MSGSTTMQQGRIDKTLDTKMRYREGVMSRRQWILLRIKNNAKASIIQVPAVKFDRVKYNRMDDRQQADYDARLAQTKAEYRIHQGDTFWTVTKIEYDFFLASGGEELTSV